MNILRIIAFFTCFCSLQNTFSSDQKPTGRDLAPFIEKNISEFELGKYKVKITRDASFAEIRDALKNPYYASDVKESLSKQTQVFNSSEVLENTGLYRYRAAWYLPVERRSQIEDIYVHLTLIEN